tara:strand:- start:2665 stop:2832 length:168 start_codon:yes stop_codon:yes gene_type:complete
MKKQSKKSLATLSKALKANQKKQKGIVDSTNKIVDNTILSLIKKNITKISKYDRK